MLATVNTLVLTGIEAKAVKVEVDLMRALPGFDIVGSKNVKRHSLYSVYDIHQSKSTFMSQ